ncbi:hypothetical protein AJ79_01870 [Helicocarpus griseus UAMH5409]|uniref:Sialidase domain-containing protein n=1 Tax=Helicocarpus griseus UAMH5409 TaxID=1447875 RepID=A0A2B7Y605_9EURO|nr:hypothetical protein AJ79_01870 [Helicocarpus griseus UAMH5409]
MRQVSKLIRFGLAALSHFQHGHSRPLATDQLPGEAALGNEIGISNLPGSYARLAKLSDGSVLAGFTTAEGPTKIIKVSKSTDGGRQFFPFGEITRGEGDIGNIFLLEIAPSVILGAFRNHSPGPGGMHFRITVCKSTDGGKSWGFASQAFELGGHLGIWEPFMRLSDRNPNEVQLTYSHEFAPNDQRTMLVRSTDGGISWSRPEAVCFGNAVRDGMNGIAKTKDGNRDVLVMVFETTDNAPFFNVKAALSYDDGATWGYRQNVQVAPRDHNAGAPQIASFADGCLAVVYMADEGLGGSNWPHKASIKVTFAAPPRDGKMSWSTPQLAKESGFWPGILDVQDNVAMITYDSGGPRAKPIQWSPK